MWPFNKKIIFSSYYWDVEVVKESFDSSPKNFPGFLKTMPSVEFCPFSKVFRPAQKTIKSCSGFVNLFKRSILFKMPCDFHAIFDEEKILECDAGSSSNARESFISIHNNNQLLKYVKTDYKFIVKIQPQVFITSNVSTLMHTSFFHFNNLDITPGILHKKFAGDLNFFIGIKKGQKELLIKKGTPLCLLTPLTEKKVNIVFNSKIPERKNNPRFTGLHDYVLDRL